MALEVEIMDVDESGSTLDVSVSVTVDDTETVEYELNINDTGTGGEVTRSGTLYGGSGSYPGDSNIEEVSFGIGDTTGGTVTAVITAPDRYVGSEYQSQEKWGDSGDGSVGEPTINVSNCDPQPTSDGDLEVSYTLAPTDDSSGDVGITIRVDGQRVGYENHYVPARGGSFSQTIPADNMPTGTDMPVEIGVDGDFSDCGTVTIEDVPAVELLSCDTSFEDGEVVFSVELAATGDTEAETEYTWKVGPASTGPVTDWIPPDGLTADVPIEPPEDPGEYETSIVIDGEEYPCGTVDTTDTGDSPDAPVSGGPTIEGCSIVSESPLEVEFEIDGDEGGDALVWVSVGGETVTRETFRYYTNPATHTVSVPVEDLPVGQDQPVELAIVDY